MKKLLVIISTLNYGGAQKIISNLLESLPGCWEADIILNDAENIVYPYEGNIISLGFKPQADKTKLLYQLKVFLKRIVIVGKYKKTGKYTACVSGLTSANIANILTRKKGCQTVISEHCYMTEEAGRGIHKYIIDHAIRYFYNRADKIVVVSNGVGEDLIQNFQVKREKVCTIYNGFSLQEIRQMSEEPLSIKEKEWFSSGPVLVTVGRLSRQKGQWHLIRALKKVKKLIPKVRLLVLGEGELENELKQITAALGLKDAVVFCGFCKNPYKIMKHCDLFVFSSLYEGFGNVIIESFCCGLPCISTDFNAGAREIMAPGTNMNNRVTQGIEKADYGILCPVCDGLIRRADEGLSPEEDTMADAILELLKNDTLRKQYASAGRKRAEDFDMKHIIRQWLEVMEA